jgi:hypothetical protein
VLVAHACNPSYSEGTDQEGCSSNPAQGKIVHKILSRKNPSQIMLSRKKKNHTQKRASGVAQALRAPVCQV